MADETVVEPVVEVPVEVAPPRPSTPPVVDGLPGAPLGYGKCDCGWCNRFGPSEG